MKTLEVGAELLKDLGFRPWLSILRNHTAYFAEKLGENL